MIASLTIDLRRVDRRDRRDARSDQADRPAQARLSDRRAASLVQGRIRKAAGYAVGALQQIADAIKTDLGLSQLAVEWVPVTSRAATAPSSRERSICSAAPRPRRLREGPKSRFRFRSFPGGIGALMRADAPARLREVLTGRQGPTRPIWRGTVDPALQRRTFSAVTGTTAEQWLSRRVNEFKLTAQVAPVQSYDAGVQRVLDRDSDVLFGDRALLLDAATTQSVSARVDRARSPLHLRAAGGGPSAGRRGPPTGRRSDVQPALRIRTRQRRSMRSGAASRNAEHARRSSG